jgi:OmpA-OmpF porin, OOP family
MERTMKNHCLNVVSSLLVVLCASLGFAVTDLHANDKPKVISSGDLNADGLVDALDIGPSAAPKDATKDEALTRGMKPLRPPSARASAPGASSNAAAGKAPLLLTFKTGSTELTSEAMTMLSKVAQALQSERLAGYSFAVEGHADPRGKEGQNLKLSQGRADSVARHLTVQHGVQAERLKPVGRGSAELYDLVRTDAPENRRVTLVTLRP